MRVLVFDDEAAVGRLVARVATLAGLEASAVTDVTAFEAHMLHDAPEIVVLDLQLEDTDGVAELRWLAAESFRGSVVLVSGFDTRVLATAKSVGLSLGLNVVAAMEKPLRLAELETVFKHFSRPGTSVSAERFMRGIAAGELELDFQPVVARHARAIKSFEALIRWAHPQNGRMCPDSFLSVIENDTASVDAMTDWMLGAAIEAWRTLRHAGLTAPISINLSAANLHDLTLPDRIERRLKQAKMPANNLCLELTETAAFADPARSLDFLTRMRLKGLQLAIDAFGTGYWSFKMLRQMPFSAIKIDRSFVSDLVTSRDAQAIVKSIFDISTNMEMDCIAEGVGSESAVQFLEQIGIRSLQGHFIARPMPVQDLPAWLTAWRETSQAVAD